MISTSCEVARNEPSWDIYDSTISVGFGVNVGVRVGVAEGVGVGEGVGVFEGVGVTLGGTDEGARVGDVFALLPHAVRVKTKMIGKIDLKDIFIP